MLSSACHCQSKPLPHGALGINPSIYKKLAYDPLKDFEYISIAVTGAYVLAVKADLPAKSFEELVQLAHTQPGVVNYASFGVGSTTTGWCRNG